jgi:hypothetical protein
LQGIFFVFSSDGREQVFRKDVLILEAFYPFPTVAASLNDFYKTYSVVDWAQ